MIDLYLEALIAALVIGPTLTAVALWIFGRQLRRPAKAFVTAMLIALVASGGVYPYMVDMHGMMLNERKFWVMVVAVLGADVLTWLIARCKCGAWTGDE